ncbi:hypothetical protein AURDEDRAFT_125289 [Auricularia subglabra TFB-10046 SS5]|nr:hypothetical protein AURDEDRAFT_125289 [Auricularia subglabra TFB-10046 SS5]
MTAYSVVSRSNPRKRSRGQVIAPEAQLWGLSGRQLRQRQRLSSSGKISLRLHSCTNPTDNEMLRVFENPNNTIVEAGNGDDPPRAGAHLPASYYGGLLGNRSSYAYQDEWKIRRDAEPCQNREPVFAEQGYSIQRRFCVYLPQFVGRKSSRSCGERVH